VSARIKKSLNNEQGSAIFEVNTYHFYSLGQAQLYFYYSDPVAAFGIYGLYVAYNVDGSTVKYTIKESTWGGGGE